VPFPPAITTRTYTGTILGPDGNPATGTLTFTLSQPLYDATNNVVIGPDRPLTATLTAGAFNIVLPAAAWHYVVRIDTDVLKDVYLLTVTAGDGELHFADTYRAAAAAAQVEFFALLGHLHQIAEITGLDTALAAIDARLDNLETGGASSTGGGTTDHGQLTGLTDDDHPHYLTQTRGDARYVQPLALVDLVTTTELGDALTAHAQAADPHPQYRSHQVRARVTTGTPAGDNLPNTGGVWQQYAPVGELAIDAQPGDELQIQGGWLSLADNDSFYEIAITVDGALVWFGSTETSTPSPEGDPALYPGLRPTGWYAAATVTPDLIDTDGQVHVVLAIRTTGTSGKLYYSSAYPFRWQVRNHR
jgi:hypothetical protein